MAKKTAPPKRPSKVRHEVHGETGLHAFYFTVDGDCMSPKYNMGDQVLFDPDQAKRIVEGESYFIQLDRHEQLFRRVYFHPKTRGVLVLKPWNDAYPERMIGRFSPKVFALAVAVIRSTNKPRRTIKF